MLCNICASEVNEKIIKTCNNCNFQCCYKCIKTYMLSNSKDYLDCMNCHVKYTRRTIYDMFGPTFINTTYSTYKKNIIHQDHLIKVPSIQPYIIENIVKIITSDLLLENIIQERDIKLFLRHYKDSMKQNQNNIVSLELYVGPCMNPQCDGFRNHNSYCKICGCYTCEDCLSIKSNEHICKKEDILSAVFIKKDTKHCPKCNTGIYKISGCDQMFCTSCHCVFDWSTLEINKDSTIHNPHYFEYMAANNHIMNDDNNNCLTDTQLFNILSRIVIGHYVYEARVVYFRSFYDFIHDYQSCIRVKRERLENKMIILRMQYLIHYIDKKYFLTHSMKYHKRIEYYDETLLLLDTVKQVSIDLLRKFVIESNLGNDMFLMTLDIIFKEDFRMKVKNFAYILDLNNMEGIIIYINEEFNKLHKLYYGEKEDYNLITFNKTKDIFNYYAIRNI